MAHCSFSTVLPGRWRDGAAGSASLLAALPARRPADRRRPGDRCRRTAGDARATQKAAPTPGPDAAKIVDGESSAGVVRELLRRLVDWALGEEEEEDAEAVLFFVVRTSVSQFRVGGRPDESIADLLARVVRLAMMPEHGGLAGASVRVCTACGRALAAGTSLNDLKSRELLLADRASDIKERFDGYADHLGAPNVEKGGGGDNAQGRDLRSDCRSEAAPATSFIQDPDLGPAVLISPTAGSRPRAGSETLLCNLQF